MNFGPNTEGDTKNFIQQAIKNQREQPRRNFDFAIIAKGDDCLIGDCGLYICDVANREGRIGYLLSHESWGHGFATETARGLLRFGFNDLHLHRIFTHCDLENVASAHVLEKIGMQQEGHLRKSKLRSGQWKDELLYAILEA